MAVLHSSFCFGLNTLLEMCILLHLAIANKCTIVVSEEHEMASFIQTEQCVNVAYLYGPLVIKNTRINVNIECFRHHSRFPWLNCIRSCSCTCRSRNSRFIYCLIFVAAVVVVVVAKIIRSC